MSFFSDLINALKRAAGRREPDVDIEQVRGSGGLGPTDPTDAFDPLRPDLPHDGGSEVHHGDISISSGDPEEGGEVTGPVGPVQ